MVSMLWRCADPALQKNQFRSSQEGNMNRKAYRLSVVIVLVALLPACAARIHGMVRLVDENMQPITDDTPTGSVINIINTSVPLEQASHSVIVNDKGKFGSVKDSLQPGKYRVEASRIGYVTETESVDLGKYTQKRMDFKLKRIEEGQRKSIKGSTSDADKIINPGEVNLEPPMM